MHTSVADTCLFPGMSRVGGVIREAQVADFVVLSGDPFSEASWQPPGRISVLETYVGGQRVFSAEERDVLIAIQQKQ